MSTLTKTAPFGHDPDASGSIERQLLILGPETLACHPLPNVGALLIGRSEAAHIQLNTPAASRRHATLHVAGLELFLEDHGSANGTKVAGKSIPPGQRVRVDAGVAIEVGTTTLMVQWRSHGEANLLRVWPHVYFEGRLEDECRRARPQDLFAVVRLRVRTSHVASEVVSAIEPVLGWRDALGSFGPSQWEVLLVNRTLEQLALAISRLRQFVREAGIEADVGIARYPDHGRHAERLIAAAGDDMYGAAPSASLTPPVDPAMKLLYTLAERVARSDLNVLIVGETGVGKDVLASHIHATSARATKPLLSLNCAALSESLLESELFGHERGAFTGAVQNKQGLLEAAPGGTIFFDELGELPLAIQAKLLRVIETREIMRLGGTKPKTIDVRFIAATNRKLEAEVERGNFRRDLYYRLNGITLALPALRERPAEIVPLARVFAQEAAKRLGLLPPQLSPEAEHKLEAYPWPGNIRELKNVVERAVVLSDGGCIQPVHVSIETMVVIAAEQAGTAEGSLAEEPRKAPDDLRNAVVEALSKAAGNQTRAAQALGISRRTLIRRLDDFGLARPLKTTEAEPREP